MVILLFFFLVFWFGMLLLLLFLFFFFFFFFFFLADLMFVVENGAKVGKFLMFGVYIFFDCNREGEEEDNKNKTTGKENS